MFDVLNFDFFINIFVNVFKFVAEFFWALFASGLLWSIFKVAWPILLIMIIIKFLPSIIDRVRHDFLRKKKSFQKTMANTYIDENGYKRFSDSGKLVSRWVAEKKLGRKLNDEDVVHHKNRNKLDNRPSNLWVFGDQDDHERVHEEDGDFDDEDYYDIFDEEGDEF